MLSQTGEGAYLRLIHGTTREKEGHMKVSIGKILLFGFALLVVYRIGIMIPGFRENYREEWNLEHTFDQYTGSLVSQQYEKAYATCSGGFQQVTPYDKFVDLYKSLQEQYGPLKSAKSVGHEMRGSGTPTVWKAVIDANFIYAKQTIRFEFSAHKDGDRWVLDGFEQL